jgi:hypothetical protein
MSARGGSASISFAHLQDLVIVTGPVESEILSSLTEGVVVVAQDSGGVRFEKGVTTYVDDQNGTTDKPFSTFSRIKYVTTMQGFERDNREANEQGDRLGRLAVNSDTREFLVAEAQVRLDARIANKEIQPGAKVGIATSPPPSDDDEFVALEWVGRFARSLEQIRNTFFLN